MDTVRMHNLHWCSVLMDTALTKICSTSSLQYCHHWRCAQRGALMDTALSDQHHHYCHDLKCTQRGSPLMWLLKHIWINFLSSIIVNMLNKQWTTNGAKYWLCLKWNHFAFAFKGMFERFLCWNWFLWVCSASQLHGCCCPLTQSFTINECKLYT